MYVERKLLMLWLGIMIALEVSELDECDIVLH